MAEITPQEAWEQRDDALLLDVREPGEWVAGHVEGALHVPMGQLGQAQHLLDVDRRIVCICRSGNRSAAVTDALRGAGYDAVNMVGGMHAWSAAGLPWVSEGDEDPYVA